MNYHRFKPYARHNLVPLSAAFALGALPFHTSSAASDEAADSFLEEVTVTARKREESLQDVPVSVVATSGADIEKLGIRSMDQIAHSAPGLFFASFGASGINPQVGMRGNSTRATIVQNDPTVGLFVDGIYTPSAVQLMHGPVDVKRIEVLAGPQGTLYGRNTISGAISVLTNDPTETFEGKMKVGAGQGAHWNEKLWNVEALVSGPLSDTVAARLVYAHKEREGYQYNTLLNKHLGFTKSDYVRGKLHWTPGGNVNVKVGVEYAESQQPRSDALGYISGGFHPSVTARPESEYFFPGFSGSLYEMRTNVEADSEATIQRTYAQVDWNLPVGTLTSLSAYSISKLDAFWDNDASQFDAQELSWVVQQNTFTQELRLNGNAGSWNWLAGLFYMADDLKKDVISIDFGPDSTAFVAGTGRQFQDHKLQTDSYAVFGQVGYEFTPALALTLGGRFSRDEKESPFTFQTFNVSDGAVRVSTNVFRKDSWDSTTGLASLSYRWSEGVMTYASYSSGFKAGGFQPGANPIVATTPFEAEEVDQIEVGLKSMWAGNRVRLNISAYQLDYSDLQVNSSRVVNNLPVQFIGNAADANVRGMDLDLTLAPVADLTFGLKYTWTPTAEIEGFTTIAGFPSIEGFRLPRTPKHAYVAMVDYAWDAFGGEISVGADYTHRSDFVGEMDATRYPNGSYAVAPVSSYSLLALTAGFEIGAWRFDTYVRNALDEEYLATRNGIGGAGRYEFWSVGEPRTWEVSLTRSFK